MVELWLVRNVLFDSFFYQYYYAHCLQEYEHGTSPEAVVVKDLDKFDMIFQAFEYEQGRSFIN